MNFFAYFILSIFCMRQLLCLSHFHGLYPSVNQCRPLVYDDYHYQARTYYIKPFTV